MAKSNKNQRKDMGDWGERIARHHLEAKQFVIQTTNWRNRYGEIDLIATHNGHWHFIEVKTRRGRRMGLPEEAITPQKATRLAALAQMYLTEYDLNDVDFQIDLIAIELDQTGKLIRCDHVEHIITG